MTEEAAVPFALVFGIITVLLVRSRDVKTWEAVMICLFGLYLGQTPVIFTVDGIVTWFFSGFTHT
ncbi:hypothetical protein [Streptomyces xantholiticus]|uniref:hypothetical protein n=1 Tax=Streptomyces xantholiticus TaxID=68285 RepID=UPI00167553AA|nr:hypothetical protein [Streptomyces xantholiticus]GGW55139.1 hypothetical protein GCM10010381_45760 [Streptomyces xantholiticus]